MEPGADLRAPGAAITVALCGHWEHEPPCPIATHHTSADRVGEDVRTRTLFATDADREGEVRTLIDHALAGGQLHTPDGAKTRWQVRGSHPGVISAAESDHADRLLG